MKTAFASLLLAGALSQGALAHPALTRLLAVSPYGLVVQADGGWQKSIQLTPETFLHRGSRALTAIDLRPGQFLHVRDQVLRDGSYRAVDVDVLPALHVHGSVLSREGDLLTVDFHHRLVPVRVVGDTVSHVGWLPSSPGLVGPGMHVHVDGDVDASGALVADRIDLHFPWVVLAGACGLTAATALALHRRRRQAVRQPIPRVDD